MSTAESIRADALQAEDERHHGLSMEVRCPNCDLSWSVRTFDGEPIYVEATLCDCGEIAEEV